MKGKGRKKRWMSVLIVVIALGALIGLATLGWVCWNERHAGDELSPRDAVIVLGARVKPEGVLSNSLEYRMETALSIYQQGLTRYIIVCGAQGSDEPLPEAHAMRDYLLARGVPEDCVLMDDTSVNTRQNLEHAKAIMDEQGLTTAIVVSNAYHVARAKALARDVGIDALGAAAKMPRGFYIPWKMRVREALSWLNYWIFGGQ